MFTCVQQPQRQKNKLSAQVNMTTGIVLQPHVVLAKVVADLRAAAGGDRSFTRSALRQAVQDVVADCAACVLVADSNGRLVAASRTALVAVGHNLATLRQLNITQLAADEEQPAVEPLWESFLRERAQTGNFLLRDSNGRTISTRYAAQTNVVGGLAVAVHVLAA